MIISISKGKLMKLSGSRINSLIIICLFVPSVFASKTATDQISSWSVKDKGLDQQITPLSSTLYTSADTNKDDYVFIINKNDRAQQYLGIGSSFDGTTIHNIWNMDSAAAHQKANGDLGPNGKAVLQKLFGNGENDFGWNLARVTLGTSDFTLPCYTGQSSDDPRDHVSCPNGNPFYTYEDIPGQFSITPKDRPIDQEKITVIKDATDISNQIDPSQSLLLMGSLWSPPGWMKDSNSLLFGKFKKDDDNLQAMVNYYLDIFRGFSQQGIHLYSISEFNEPGIPASIAQYPNTDASFGSQRKLLKKLKNALNTIDNGIFRNIKVWMYDFNVSGFDPKNLLDDDESLTDSDGIALHNYYYNGSGIGHLQDIYNAIGGDNKPSSTGRNEFKGIYMTEFHFNNDPDNFAGATGAAHILELFHYGVSSYINWATVHALGRYNTATDEWNNKKGWDANPVNLTSEYALQPNDLSFNYMDYALAAISKFVYRGGHDDYQNNNAYVLRSNPSNGDNNYYDPNHDKNVSPSPTQKTKDNLPKVSMIAFVNPDIALQNNPSMGKLVAVLVNRTDSDKGVTIYYNNRQSHFHAVLPAYSTTSFSWSSNLSKATVKLKN